MFASLFSSTPKAHRTTVISTPMSPTLNTSPPRRFMAHDFIKSPLTHSKSSLMSSILSKQPAMTSFPERTIDAYDPETEPIKAYLRLRPPHADKAVSPYIEVVNKTEIIMTPPQDSGAFKTRSRQPERYKFTEVFDTKTPQKNFFDETTLPLVKDVLKGENALLFAYGVTNSGKTYSIQGTPQEPGILPKCLDVIFNSLDGLHSDSRIRPIRLDEVELGSDDQFKRDSIASFQEYSKHSISALPPRQLRQSLMNDMLADSFNKRKADKTTAQVEDGSEYSVWVSYAEIYNEKIYDLLETPPASQSNGQTVITRKALSLKKDSSTKGRKYIHGLKEVRIRSAEEAQVILRRGQINRRVFSTLSNRESSRSHGVFTVKILRLPINTRTGKVLEDSSLVTVSRLSIVDLAGSERTKNTHTSGDRLKEAGSINKSLMVLGQCVEILRLNQTKSEGRKPAIVPFRHSKLTELFQSAFVGDGKAVMIVNVNPYDTGFDENLHVMKFSSVARNVTTIKHMPSKIDHGQLRSLLKLQEEVDDEMESTMVEEEVADSEDEDGFVDALLEQIDELHEKWVTAETRCASIEADAREEVTVELEERIHSMELMYLERLQSESLLSEEKTDRKLDILARGGAAHDEESEELYETIEEQDVEIRCLEEKIKEQRRELEQATEMLEELRLENSKLKDGEGKEGQSKKAVRGRPKKSSTAMPKKTVTSREDSPDTEEDENENSPMAERPKFTDSVMTLKDSDDCMTPTKKPLGVNNSSPLATPAAKMIKVTDNVMTTGGTGLTTTGKKRRKLRTKKAVLDDEINAETEEGRMSPIRDSLSSRGSLATNMGDELLKRASMSSNRRGRGSRISSRSGL